MHIFKGVDAIAQASDIHCTIDYIPLHCRFEPIEALLRLGMNFFGGLGGHGRALV